MTLWDHVFQIWVDIAYAMLGLPRAIYIALFDAKGRRRRFAQRVGIKYARYYEKKGMFRGLGSHAAVAIRVRNGDFVAGDTYLDARKAFIERYNGDLRHIHSITRPKF